MLHCPWKYLELRMTRVETLCELQMFQSPTLSLGAGSQPIINLPAAGPSPHLEAPPP